MKKLSAIITMMTFIFGVSLSSVASADSKHPKHGDHKHEHKEGCGHKAEKHGDHTDYEHDGHHHHKHDGHWDECETGPHPKTEKKKAKP